LGCTKDFVSSIIPEISFQSATVYKNRMGSDSIVILNINYKDGDGDLGLSESDTFPPYNFGNIGFYNLLVSYEVKNGNSWKKIILPGSGDTLHFNQRFERLNKSDKEKAVTGFIEIRIPAIPYPGIEPDTIRLVSQVMDRKLRLSNMAISNDIYLKH